MINVEWRVESMYNRVIVVDHDSEVRDAYGSGVVVSLIHASMCLMDHLFSL